MRLGQVLKNSGFSEKAEKAKVKSKQVAWTLKTPKRSLMFYLNVTKYLFVMKYI